VGSVEATKAVSAGHQREAALSITYRDWRSTRVAMCVFFDPDRRSPPPSGLAPHDPRRFLPEGDFRTTRHYLADRAFAIAPGESMDPTDPIDQATWDGVMVLPTDVALRTADHQGSLVEDTHAQWAAWIHSLPTDPSVAPFIFEAAWDAADEFGAAPFIAAHGWYRQATAALRTALESIAIAAGYAVRGDEVHLARWRAGAERNFGEAIRWLRHNPSVQAVEAALPVPAVFGKRGVAGDIYGHLCRYVHARPGHMNADIWASHGPVWVWAVFRDFWMDYCDVTALSYVLLKLGWPDLVVPETAKPLFGAASPRWHGIAESAATEYGLISA
jgi:hypothetical protein